jgi:hypothetical protein
MGRDGLGPDSSAYGVRLDYPNDLWNTVVKYYRVGQDFDPSLGFVARPGVHAYTVNTEFRPRRDFWNIRQMSSSSAIHWSRISTASGRATACSRRR